MARVTDTGASSTVRRLAERPVSAGDGVVSRHGLSFGAHYDPERTSFGALVAHNDDVLEPGAAYGAHEHRDVEILTWVLSGAMAHVGPDGREDVVGVGTLQHLAAGTGWHHDERCAGPDPVHLLQMWIAPALDDPPVGEPSLTHVAVDPDGGAVTVPLRRPGVTLAIARLAPAQRWAPEEAGWRYVHVARGGLGYADLRAGDGLEVVGDAMPDLVAGGDGAEVLVVATR